MPSMYAAFECYCRAHIEHEFNKLRSSNTVSVRVKSVGDWWEADPESKLFRLAERALAREWNVQPLFVREGGTMPVSIEPSDVYCTHLQAAVSDARTAWITPLCTPVQDSRSRLKPKEATALHMTFDRPHPALLYADGAIPMCVNAVHTHQ